MILVRLSDRRGCTLVEGAWAWAMYGTSIVGVRVIFISSNLGHWMGSYSSSHPVG